MTGRALSAAGLAPGRAISSFVVAAAFFIAAVAEMTEGVRAVVNVNCLNDRARFTSVPQMHEFQGETIESRLSRRAANWMPAILSTP